jgi:hypothetical protein
MAAVGRLLPQQEKHTQEKRTDTGIEGQREPERSTDRSASEADPEDQPTEAEQTTRNWHERQTSAVQRRKGEMSRNRYTNLLQRILQKCRGDLNFLASRPRATARDVDRRNKAKSGHIGYRNRQPKHDEEICLGGD